MSEMATGSSAEDQSICPFGEKLQRYWDKRHEYFSRFNEGIQIDKEGLYSVTPERIALDIGRRIKGARVLDAFCGVGGNAIGMARAGKEVIAVELDKARLQMAMNNAEVYGVRDRIEFVQGDIRVLMQYILADAYFFDPPWGGPAYAKKDNFSLHDFDPDGADLLKAAWKDVPEVAFKVPRIMDMQEIASLNKPFTIEEARMNDRHLFSTVYFE